jgi:hypothetical protein
MFNLEQAIADWRQNMLAAGIETPVPLEELELHLREEIERQVRAGLEAQEAFDQATQRIGEAQSLKAEFKKLPTTPHDKFQRIVVTSWYLTFGLFMIQKGYRELAAVDFKGNYFNESFLHLNLRGLFDLLDLCSDFCELLCGLGILGLGLIFIYNYPNFGPLIQRANDFIASAFCSIRNLCGAGGSRA